MTGEAGDDELAVRVRCVVAARREDDGDDAERDDERAGGYRDVQPPGLLEAALEPHSSPVPPPIR